MGYIGSILNHIPQRRDCHEIMILPPFLFTVPFKSCQQAYESGFKYTGLYPIHLMNVEAFNVPCDMATDGGGWIVFQRRVDATIDFYRLWNEYKNGFGDMNGNFWLGLEKLHKLAAPGKGAILRVDVKHMTYPNELKYAKYNTFEISNEADGYRLQVGGYTGNAGDSMQRHNGCKFTTKDRDQDTWNGNCAVSYHGAWWYTGCHDSNLNGLYPTAIYSTDPKYISWKAINNYHGGIIFSEMKIKCYMP